MWTRSTVFALVVAIAACGADVDDPDETAMDDAGTEETEQGLSEIAGADTGTPADVDWSDEIVAERGGFIPEGVEYDAANNRFLTGSLAEGSVFEIAPDGSMNPFIRDADLISSVGIEVDEERNRLLVTNSDREVFQGQARGHAMLGVYDLQTGDRIAMVDLGATIPNASDTLAHFANDVAVADDGTVYVTDTRAGVIYEVGSDYEASVFWDPEGPNPGFNGIEVHPDGYLLVAGGTELRKVPLDNPSNASLVSLPEEIPGQDGIAWVEPGRLAVVSNSGNRTVVLTSDDDWASAQIAEQGSYDVQATTAAVVDGEIYVVHPHFADAEPPSISRVELQ